MKSCRIDTHTVMRLLPCQCQYNPHGTQVKSKVVEKNNTMKTGYVERLNPDAVQYRGFRADGLCVTYRIRPGKRFEGRDCD
jgi:hypothetical protein